MRHAPMPAKSGRQWALVCTRTEALSTWKTAGRAPQGALQFRTSSFSAGEVSSGTSRRQVRPSVFRWGSGLPQQVLLRRTRGDTPGSDFDPVWRDDSSSGRLVELPRLVRTEIQRAAHLFDGPALHGVGVYHRGADIAVPKQLLNGTHRVRHSLSRNPHP